MIKLEFPDCGGMCFQFPKPKNQKQAECFDRLGQMINEMEEVNPSLVVLLGIAASNGPKTFDKALHYFNVA